jgi:NADH-quinone oxidoreductase subunit L
MASSLILTAIVAPWIGGLLVWLAGDRRPRWQHGLAVAAGLVATAASIALLQPHLWGSASTAAFALPLGAFIGDLTFVADSLAVYLAIIATSVGSLTIIFSIGYMAGAAQLGRYYMLVLLFIGSMCGLVFSGNLLFLFLFWEATAFCSYALISFHNDDPKAVAAGIEALIITQIGGAGLLIGIIIAAAYLPDLQISTFLASANGIPATILAVTAFGFLLAAMAKSAQVPLHVWLPDAMEAPTPVSALIHAATMVNAGVYLLARFYPAFKDVPMWADAVIVVGVLSALLAALLATTCNDLKRVLAYSTVSQLGYMVAAVGLGAIYESQFFLMSHALFKALLFLGAGAIIHELGTRDMRQMGGLWQRMPRVAVPFLIGACALVGLPFFNGFWSKELLLEFALERFPGSVFPALAIGAGITALYVTRMCWMVFFARPAEERAHGHGRISPFMIWPLIILAVGVMFSWLLAEPFARWMLATMPFHAELLFHDRTVESLISTHTAASLSTLVTLLITAVGIMLGWTLTRSGDVTSNSMWSQGIGKVESFFIDLLSSVAGATQETAALLQYTQTGQLNWNIAGIVLGLVALLMVLVIGVVL